MLFIGHHHSLPLYSLGKEDVTRIPIVSLQLLFSTDECHWEIDDMAEREMLDITANVLDLVRYGQKRSI